MQGFIFLSIWHLWEKATGGSWTSKEAHYLQRIEETVSVFPLSGYLPLGNVSFQLFIFSMYPWNWSSPCNRSSGEVPVLSLKTPCMLLATLLEHVGLT